jgi:hypothetical protein
MSRACDVIHHERSVLGASCDSPLNRLQSVVLSSPVAPVGETVSVTSSASPCELIGLEVADRRRCGETIQPEHYAS